MQGATRRQEPSNAIAGPMLGTNGRNAVEFNRPVSTEILTVEVKWVNVSYAFRSDRYDDTIPLAQLPTRYLVPGVGHASILTSRMLKWG